MLVYLFCFLISFFLCYILTFKIKGLALSCGIVDCPGEPRKIQKKPVPLLGGVALYISFLAVLVLSFGLGWLNDGIITLNQIIAIVSGGFIILVVGFLDDKYNLGPKSFVGPLLAALIAVGFGITVGYVTNPFLTGTGPYGRALFYFSGFAGSIFSWLWLLGMMYTTKFLDGLDGLVSGIGAIGAVILFIVSLFWDVPQSATSILALILAGVCLGFLFHNWHPARIFLGESGSVFIGFMLGVLSIISGGKIATALLLMGIPILDVIWVILRRILSEKKSPFRADSKHLHYRLVKAGLSQRQAVLFLYFWTALFGTASLFLQSRHKVAALILVGLVMLALVLVLIRRRD